MNIYDIAKQSGYSIATVSRVLNGSSAVSAKAREKILEVIKENDYVPNAFARGLGLNTMRMIGLLCTNISDPFYAKAVSLVESHLRQREFDPLLCCTGNRLEDKKKYLDLLLQKHVDAVILIGSGFRENTDNSHIENAAKQVPVVIINGLVELPNTYCVLCNEKEAVRENVLRLCNDGFSDILYLYDALTYSGCMKLEGYRSGMIDSGTPLREDLIVRTEKNLRTIQHTVLNLLDSGVSFSAVIASEDLLAVGALEALSSRSISIPVIGFNNSILAECSTPTLTSVDNMLSSLCPTAVNLVIDLLEGREAPQKVMISSKLVVRETYKI